MERINQPKIVRRVKNSSISIEFGVVNVGLIFTRGGDIARVTAHSIGSPVTIFRCFGAVGIIFAGGDVKVQSFVGAVVGTDVLAIEGPID